MENNKTIAEETLESPVEEAVEKTALEEVLEETETPKYVPLSSLDLHGECNQIMFKPKGTLYGGLVAGVVLLFLKHPLFIGLGVFILALDLFVIFKVNDYTTLTIYPTFVLVHQLDHAENVRVVEFEDIEEWTAKDNEGKTNCIIFKLKSGEMIYKDTFESTKAFNRLNKLMPEKEMRAVQARKNREKKVEFKFRFKNPFKKK